MRVHIVMRVEANGNKENIAVWDTLGKATDHLKYLYANKEDGSDAAWGLQTFEVSERVSW